LDVGDERSDEGTELGAVKVHRDVIAAIARLAALKVPGVVDMSGSFTDGLASMLSKNTEDRGIKVDLEGHSVSVELNIVVEYGVRIPQVAWRIQNEVARAIEEMTGNKVKAVDVVVKGIKCLPDKPPSAGGEGVVP
jgi:uncharacterized alkaline shock family protein YloU